MRSDVVVIASVGSQDPAQTRFAQHYDMIDAFPADRTDQPFGISILPWGHGSSTVLSAKYIAAPLTKRIFQMEKIATR
jgi:hypothetical protein